MSTRALVVSWSLVGVFVVVLALGYIMRWSWTGFRQDRQLWDLLHLIVLPAVLVTLPLWYRTRVQGKFAWRAVFAAVSVVFAVLIIGGYGLGWTWTGFAGNTLWDWLELLALPVVVALLPLWVETHRRLEARWRITLGLFAFALTITIIGGYGLGWTWTGFEGNTLLQWVRMLFVPFVLPASIAWYSTQARLQHAEEQAAARLIAVAPVPVATKAPSLPPRTHRVSERKGRRCWRSSYDDRFGRGQR